MESTEIIKLTIDLYHAQLAEKKAKEHRMDLENRMAKAIGMPDSWEGSMTNKVGNYKVKVSRRMNVKIDADRLNELAHENGLDAQLRTLFRWKPEIAKAAWDAAAPEVVKALSPAIERTPGKASFTVELIPNKNNQ